MHSEVVVNCLLFTAIGRNKEFNDMLSLTSINLLLTHTLQKRGIKMTLQDIASDQIK